MPDWIAAPALGARFNRLVGIRPARRAAKPGAPRIAVIGNCQASAIAQAMTLLLPDAEVRYRSIYRITREFNRLADLVAAFREYDVVFASPFSAPFADERDFEDLRAGVRLVQMPVIVFSAFHPDLVYVQDRTDRSGSRHIQSPIGPYNSALALFGYLSDFTVEETVRLFNHEAFQGLSYFSMWDLSMTAFLGLGQQAGYDLAESGLRWARRGAFMHSINHPKMYVACDLGRGLLRKAGIAFSDFDVEAYALDELMREGTFPVYPEIGEAYGTQGGYHFVARSRQTGEIIRNLGLRDFVAGSFAGYARRRRADFDCPRVEGWMANAPLGPWFLKWAGRVG